MERFREVLNQIEAVIDYKDDHLGLKEIWNNLSDAITEHEAKIEEEAEERYRKALSYYDKETYMNGRSTVAAVNAIRLASGKEDEG